MFGRSINLGHPVSDHPINAGLINWWIGLPNLSGTTTLFDLKKKTNGVLTNFTAPFTNTSGWLPDTKTPFSTIAFDGTDDVVDCGSPLDYAGATALTVSCRAVTYTNGTSSGAAGLRYLTAAEDVVIANAANFILRYAPVSGYVEFYTNNGLGYSPACTDTINPTIGVEYHWVATFTGNGNNILYRDGVQSNSVASGMTALNNTICPLRIGSDYQSSGVPDVRPWNGTINDIRIYNRALSATEVWELYRQALSGHPNTLNRFSRKSRVLVSSPAAPTLPTTWHLKPNASPGTIWEIYS